MTVQQEIKSQLAKLLATEDLVVEHRKVETAQFDVGTRVLTLPIWNASDIVFDMLVGHEVAHALFTPDQEWWKDHKIPQQFVNVCEDVRVEKLMKRKYLGIAKSFYRGYNELNNQDFFEIDGEDLSNFNLADRANLYFKIGQFVDVSFSVPEKEIVDLIGSAETFSQMLNAAEKLYDYCKKQQEENEKVNPEKQSELDNAKLEMEAPNLGEDTTEYEDQEESDDNLESSPQTPQMEESGSDRGNDIPESQEEPEVKTADSLESKLQDLVNTEGPDNVYVEIPKVNLDSVIASNAEVHEEIDAYWDVVEKQWSDSEYMYHAYGLKDSIFNHADSDYLKFKRSAQKEVNYLVKEFECRKAADNYSRSSINRTGVLDTAKLHTYRFNEDIFKRITTVPDGKNHGLVFILDWSGSMAHEMNDTIKQLYNLIWFCKKVNIPFEVYAFSNEWYTRNSGYTRDEGLFENDSNKLKSHYERKEYQLHVEDTFALMNILTSKSNAKTLEHQLLNIWRISLAFTHAYNAPYRYPNRLSLSGTPLNESLISLHQIIPQFQKENKVQKVQCIILTDGEASQIPYNKKVQRHWEDEDFLGCRGCQGGRTFLRDRKVGKTYKFGWNYHEFTQTLITNLKDRFPTTNFIGIRIIAGREAMRFARLYFTNPEEHVKLENQWKKQKSFTIKTSGYDAYFALSSSNLADDAEFDVKEDATKAQIKRAFAKSLKTKKMNKKVLGEFVELVA